MPTQTPWGPSQSSKKIAVGIMEYTTPSHGGIHLSAKKNLLVHEAWRTKDGFYEEDVQWSIVACTFPTLFPEHIAQARTTAKNYYPHQFMKVYETTVHLHESSILREEADSKQYADQWIAVSAFGNWHAKVPEGKIAVCCVKGGQGIRTGGIQGKEERWFMIEADQYKDPTKRCSLGYIVQPWDMKIDPLSAIHSKRRAIDIYPRMINR